jgi:hypothetical protein
MDAPQAYLRPTSPFGCGWQIRGLVSANEFKAVFPASLNSDMITTCLNE